MSIQSEIKESFETVLKNSGSWSRFIGSQFINGLSLFISQVFERCTQAASRALQESFLSKATKRASILAGAEDKGYIGLKISPSTGQATITNNSDKRITLPANTQTLSAGLVEYCIIPTVDLQAGESVTVDVEQKYLTKLTVEVEESEAWLSVVLPKSLTALTHQLDVYVNGKLWEKSFKFRNTDSTSEVYMEYYKASEQLGVRFGNGTTGKLITAGDVIELDVWCTNGDSSLMDGQKLDLIEELEYLNDSLSIVTATPITGGADGEDIESIRNGALYATAYDEQIVWNGDYETFIKRNVGGLIWLSVWGEKEQEKLDGEMKLSNINKVFISAYSNVKDDASLAAEIIKLVESEQGYNEKCEYSARIDMPYTVEVTGYVLPNYRTEDAEIAIKDQLNSIYGRDVKNKPHRVYENELWDVVNSLKSTYGIEEFNLTPSNLPLEVPVNGYSYLDIDNCVINFVYR